MLGGKKVSGELLRQQVGEQEQQVGKQAGTQLLKQVPTGDSSRKMCRT